MIVGICVIELYIYGAQNLKDKRRVIRSIIERCQSRYRVSMAEVGDADLWQRAVLGVAYVSNERSHAERVLDKVIRETERQGEVEILRAEKEIQ